jgi:hypothetical protein
MKITQEDCKQNRRVKTRDGFIFTLVDWQNDPIYPVVAQTDHGRMYSFTTDGRRDRFQENHYDLIEFVD